MDSPVIGSRPHPTCYLCGSGGVLLYQGMRDLLFDTPGQWNVRRCPKAACGLVWLDPLPLEEEVGKAYAKYYTHAAETTGSAANGSFVVGGLSALYELLLRVTLVRRGRRRLRSMFLDGARRGKLLEIGSGSGARLAMLRADGWNVTAVEPDARAAAAARDAYGLEAYVGTVEQAAFPAGEFDAVIMNHVLEHVYDPLRLFQECYRILRIGGRLVVVTPNAESYGHKLYRSCWRGLEPPRHLFLFASATLRELAVRAGFRSYRTWTTAANAETLVRGSMDIRSLASQQAGMGSQLKRNLLIAGSQLAFSMLHIVNRDSGEECVLKATK